MKYFLIIALLVNQEWLADSINLLEDVDETSAFEITGACNFVDIQYKKENFDQLSNCEVVFNGLKISNIDEDLSDLSFPKLMEITGYLYINNVTGLTTLQKLFPTLAVIRGNILIDGLAILITNNLNLENIGLQTLYHIRRGDVVLRHNPKLCYIDTVNWFKIVNKSKNNQRVFNEQNNDNCTDTCVDCSYCWNSHTPQNLYINASCIRPHNCLYQCYNETECYACEEYSIKECADCKKKCVINSELYNFVTSVKFDNFYMINEQTCKKMNKKPLDNVCLEQCPYDKMHYYDEKTDSCVFNKEMSKYCKMSVVIDGIDSLSSDEVKSATNCTFIKSLTIQNIPFSPSIDIQNKLFEILGQLGDIKTYLLIQNSPGIISLHFLPNLGAIRGYYDQENLTSFSTIIRNNENLQHFFKVGFVSKKGGLLVENNPSLCQDEIDNFIRQSDIKDGSSYQQVKCKIPIVKFHVIPSYSSALIHVDILKEGVVYQLVYKEKFGESFSKNLTSESIEINLKPNTTYDTHITSKMLGDEFYVFNSTLKTFKTRSHINYLNITEFTVTTDSATIKWENLNKLKNAFYLIHIDRNQSAYKIKNGWNHTNKCLMRLPEVKQPKGLDKYYQRMPPIDIENDENTFKTTDNNITLFKLLQAHCYQVSIYLCKQANILRCSQPVSQIILTNEIITPYEMTLVQRIMAFVIPVGVIGSYVLYRLFYKYRKIQKQVAIPLDPDTPLDEVLEEINYNFDRNLLNILTDFEIKKDDIDRGNLIGAGFFGEVFEAMYYDYRHNYTTKVAVKTVRDAEKDYEKFIREASIIKDLKTHHIVKCLGFVLKREPWIVMEYMENKDLLKYLKEIKPSENPEIAAFGYSLQNPESVQPRIQVRSFHDIAIEIADGMTYLAWNKCVHRDLAARNCMVAADLTVKIGDFGMTRDIYCNNVYLQPECHEAMPVRWMAPESLSKGKYTEQTDVWSYGIVLWEIVTYGEKPFSTFPDDSVVMLMIRDGYPPHLPDNCDDDIKSLMQKCWMKDSKKRILFKDIVKTLLPLITHSKKFEKVSFYHQNF